MQPRPSTEQKQCPRGQQNGGTSTQKSGTIFQVVHKDGKPVRALSNTPVVTLAQDGAKIPKCKWQQHAHLAKAGSCSPGDLWAGQDGIGIFLLIWVSHSFCFVVVVVVPWGNVPINTITQKKPPFFSFQKNFQSSNTAPVQTLRVCKILKLGLDFLLAPHPSQIPPSQTLTHCRGCQCKTLFLWV